MSEPDDVTLAFNRRDFLVASGFSLAGSLLAGCTRMPAEKAIPFLVQPEEVVPGQAYWVASTCAGCEARCGALVKCRDGRPIKLEGNPAHPASRGGLCATGQAQVLGLYDSHRLQQPRLAGKPSTWAEVDRRVRGGLAGARRVRLVTHTAQGPAERFWIERFLSSFPDGKQVTYDALSASAILDAHERTHSIRALPRYRFEGSEVIASFDADFLGTWISPVEHTAGYAQARDLSGKSPRLAWHVQLEGRMSLTGSRADRRARLLPAEIGPALTQLATLIEARALTPSSPPLPVLPSTSAGLLAEIADRLWAARGRSLVVCGSQDVEAQVVCNYVNHLLGNYGTTLDLERPSRQRTGSDRELETFLAELETGTVDAVLLRANLLYEIPGGDRIAQALKRVPLVVSFADHEDGTSRVAHAVCPEPHFLEGWSDAEPVAGLVSVGQPTIPPLGETRAFVESLAVWIERPAPALGLVREAWREQVWPRSAAGLPFETFWERTLHEGWAEVAPEAPAPKPFAIAAVRPVEARSTPGFTLVLYPTIAMLDGRHAHNPWLHELPDPITKITWDNYVSLSPAAARKLKVKDGDVVRLSLPRGEFLELPAQIQPGQHDRVAAVALGYGRLGTERFADAGPRWLLKRHTQEKDEPVGRNAARLALLAGGALSYVRTGATLRRTGRTRPLACTQLHHSLEVPEALAKAAGLHGPRPIVQETVLAAYREDRHAGAPEVHAPEHAELWGKHSTPSHRWAMAIDLNACTGCSGCVIACQAENNVPVVGRDEVMRQREMHWIRIDRYYADGEEPGQVDVVHQPMLCQHCENAPCESVCPVLATVHSSEGLNQQVYNRCVGTRYCANNCPYKVRRFNWFDYPREDKLANLVLNPDVTVRTRGVMEKCSLCVQRIQEVKMQSKARGTPIADGEIRTACQQSCPAQAIVFGDLNDPKSAVAGKLRDPRGYKVFEELHVQPAVSYLRLVRNRQPSPPSPLSHPHSQPPGEGEIGRPS